MRLCGILAADVDAALDLAYAGRSDGLELLLCSLALLFLGLLHLCLGLLSLLLCLLLLLESRLLCRTKSGGSVSLCYCSGTLCGSGLHRLLGLSLCVAGTLEALCRSIHTLALLCEGILLGSAGIALILRSVTLALSLIEVTSLALTLALIEVASFTGLCRSSVGRSRLLGSALLCGLLGLCRHGRLLGLELGLGLCLGLLCLCRRCGSLLYGSLNLCSCLFLLGSRGLLLFFYCCDLILAAEIGLNILDLVAGHKTFHKELELVAICRRATLLIYSDVLESVGNLLGLEVKIL